MGEGEIAEKILAEVQKLAVEVALINQKLGDVDEHDRALKGSNGNTGVIAKLDNVASDMNKVKAAISILEHKGCLMDDVQPIHKSDQVKWSNMRDKIGYPLIMAILMYLLFTLGPKLVALVK